MAVNAIGPKALLVLIILTCCAVFPILWAGATAGRVEYSFARDARWVDLDSDGLLDVVEKTGHTISVFRNVNGGAMERQFTVTTRMGIYLDLVADLDSDRYCELVAGELDVGGFILELDGWRLEKHPFAGDTSGLEGLPDTLDLEGDGILELEYSGTIYRQQNGTYAASGLTSGGTLYGHADLDADSKDELVFASFGSGQSGSLGPKPVTVSIASGAGGNLSFLDSVKASASSVEVVNTSRSLIFLGDRRLTEGSVVFLGTGELNRTDGTPVAWDRPINWRNLARISTGQAIHFNGSYRMDPAVVVRLLPGYPVRATGLVSDINSDGILDLATVSDKGTVSREEMTLTLWLSRANGTGVEYHVRGNAAGAGISNRIYAVDIDRDGDTDLVTLNYADDDFSVFLNTNGDFGPRNDYQLQSSLGSYMEATPTSMEFSDLDGDGNLDAISGNYNGRTVSVAPGQGGGRFGPPRVYQAFPGSVLTFNLLGLVTVQDLTGDGRPDILFWCGNFVLLVNDGRGGFAGLPPLPSLVVLFTAVAICAGTRRILASKADVPLEGLPPARAMGLRIPDVEFGVLLILLMSVFAYFSFIIMGPPSGFFVILDAAVMIAFLALAIANIIFYRSARLRWMEDDFKERFLRSARRRFIAHPALAGLSMAALGASVVVTFGPGWTSLAILAWTLVLAGLSLAYWASGWKQFLARCGRADFRKEWVQVGEKHFADDGKVSERFEPIGVEFGVRILVDRETKKEVLTIMQVGKDSYFSLVRLDKGGAVALRPSSLVGLSGAAG